MKTKNLYVYLVALAISLPAHADLILSGSPSIVDRTELNKNYTALATLLSKELAACRTFPHGQRKIAPTPPLRDLHAPLPHR